MISLLKFEKVFYGWIIVANGFFLEMVVMGTALYAYGVFLLPLSREFDTGIFGAMLGLTAMNASIALLSPVAGYLISRGSIKHCMLIGLSLLGTGFYLASLAQELWQIIAVYALFIGFGYALVAPIGASAVITNWFSSLRGRALSIAAMGTSFGGLTIVPVAAYVITISDWRTAYQVFSLSFFLISIPLVLILLVDTPEEKGLQPYRNENEKDDLAETAEMITTRDILRNRDFWLIALAISGGFSVFAAFTANLVPYAITLGFSEHDSAVFLSGLTACAIIGKVGFAAITDRIGVLATYSTAIGLNILAMILLTLIPTYYTLFVATVCVGLSSGGLLPSWPNFIGQRFGRRALAKIMGMSAPIVNGGMMLSPPLAGWIFDTYGDYRPAFIVFFIVLLVSGYALWQLTGNRSPGCIASTPAHSVCLKIIVLNTPILS